MGGLRIVLFHLLSQWDRGSSHPSLDPECVHVQSRGGDPGRKALSRHAAREWGSACRYVRLPKVECSDHEKLLVVVLLLRQRLAAVVVGIEKMVQHEKTMEAIVGACRHQKAVEMVVSSTMNVVCCGCKGRARKGPGVEATLDVEHRKASVAKGQGCIDPICVMDGMDVQMVLLRHDRGGRPCEK